jgi:hypothetical protein
VNLTARKIIYNCDEDLKGQGSSKFFLQLFSFVFGICGKDRKNMSNDNCTSGNKLAAPFGKTSI